MPRASVKVSPAARWRVLPSQLSHISPWVTTASASKGCECVSTTVPGAHSRIRASSKPAARTLDLKSSNVSAITLTSSGCRYRIYRSGRCRGALLAARLGPGKRLVRIAGGHDPVDDRRVGHLDLEDAGHDDDAGQADVGHGGLVAMAEDAGLRVHAKALLDRREARAEPLQLPGTPGGVVEAARCGQVLLDPRR